MAQSTIDGGLVLFGGAATKGLFRSSREWFVGWLESDDVLGLLVDLSPHGFHATTIDGTTDSEPASRLSWRSRVRWSCRSFARRKNLANACKDSGHWSVVEDVEGPEVAPVVVLSAETFSEFYRSEHDGQVRRSISCSVILRWRMTLWLKLSHQCWGAGRRSESPART